MSKSKYRATPTQTGNMPGGIPYIVGNEAAERFSYYGMRAILVVFMTKHLLGAGGEPDVMTDETAKYWFHIFSTAVYFFPAIGAIISDVFLGKYRTILTLSIVYCLGHLALALDETRLGLGIGLTLIAIGSGGIKPCVSAHVGDQFGASNQHLLPRVFSWFYFSINLGALVSMLLTPVLLDQYGPHLAFGLPGALMLLATWVFWWGRHSFIHVPAGGWASFNDLKTKQGLKAIGGLAVIYLFITPFWALFDQSASAWVLQARRMDRQLGIEWLPSQIGSINSVFVLCLIPIFSYFVYPLMGRFFRVTALRKISIGLFVTAAAFGVSGLIETNINGGQIIVGTPEGNSDLYSADNLIDGDKSENGWVSPVWDSASEADKDEQHIDILIRLREYKAWPLASVSINPAANINSFLQSQLESDKTLTNEVAQKCYAQQFEVLAGNTSDVTAFKSLGRWTLEAEDQLQTFSFETDQTGDTIPAYEYVVVRLHSNHGGKHVCLKQIQVNTSVTQPTGSGADVWPDVAAVGYKPHIIWQILAYLIITAAEVLVSITGLEFSYTQAPPRLKSVVMALFFFSISLGNAFTAAVNHFIENPDGSSQLEGASYYWFFTGVMLATAIAFVFVTLFYHEKPYVAPGTAVEDEGQDQPVE